MRFLQRTLKHYVGPSGFTDRQHSHSLFELASSEADGDIFYDDLDENEKKTLVRCFLDAVGPTSSGTKSLICGMSAKIITVERLFGPLHPR